MNCHPFENMRCSFCQRQTGESFMVIGGVPLCYTCTGVPHPNFDRQLLAVAMENNAQYLRKKADKIYASLATGPCKTNRS